MTRIPARLSPEVLSSLQAAVRGRVVESVDLRLCSRWRVGGRAAGLVEPADAVEAAAVLARLHETGTPAVVIGDGSNLLFDDDGLDGVIVRIGRRLSRLSIDGDTVSAGGGLWTPWFARALGRAGLAGAEHTIGIPGTIGALIAINGGSRRQGIGRNVRRMRGCDMTGRPFELDQAGAAFRYRGSVLLDRSLIVLEADFVFARADPVVLRRQMLGTLAERRRKFPRRLPNCGSVFVSDPALYDAIGSPGEAIERAGLKGLRIGGAEISPRHANFIVNTGGARSADILALIHTARNAVAAATGLWMDCEVRHVDRDGRVRPAHRVPGPGADTAP